MLSSNVTVYDDTTKEQLSERIQGADIIADKGDACEWRNDTDRTCAAYCNYDDAKSEVLQCRYR